MCKEVLLQHKLACEIKVQQNKLDHEQARGRPLSPDQPSSTLLASSPPAQGGIPYLRLLKIGHQVQGEMEVASTKQVLQHRKVIK